MSTTLVDDSVAPYLRGGISDQRADVVAGQTAKLPRLAMCRLRDLDRLREAMQASHGVPPGSRAVPGHPW